MTAMERRLAGARRRILRHGVAGKNLTDGK